MNSIRNNLERVKENIALAAEKSGRAGEDIRLVAVSKRFPQASIMEAIQAGQLLFGENYVQEAAEKKSQLPNEAALHFIGHLQSNKSKLAAQIFTMVETIDRIKLARTLNKQLEKLEKSIDILIQINIGRDPKKSGVLGEEAEALVTKIMEYPRLNIKGVMTMPPLCKNSSEARHYFKSLRLLAEELQKNTNFCGENRVELSMGMSSDYQVAIEEGATLVRVGTAIFGKRPDISPPFQP